jgi:hypothetical protein
VRQEDKDTSRRQGLWVHELLGTKEVCAELLDIVATRAELPHGRIQAPLQVALVCDSLNAVRGHLIQTQPARLEGVVSFGI